MNAKQWISTRNACPFCGKQIGFYRKCTYHGRLWHPENCPHCGKRIRVRYLGTEVVLQTLAIILAASGFQKFGWFGTVAIVMAYFLMSLVCMLFFPIVPAEDS